MQLGFIESRVAAGAIALDPQGEQVDGFAKERLPHFTIITHGVSSKELVPAVDGSRAFAGVTNADLIEAGGLVRLVKDGVAQVWAGGTIEAGNMVTADRHGRAIAFSGPAGREACILGVADIPAQEGGLCRVTILPKAADL